MTDSSSDPAATIPETAPAPAPVVAATSASLQALLTQKAALDAQFAAIPAAELIAAAKDILGRPGVTQAVADLAPIYEALPNGEAKVHIGNFRQVALAVPTILGQQLASAAQGA